jgi:hypothetical protein
MVRRSGLETKGPAAYLIYFNFEITDHSQHSTLAFLVHQWSVVGLGIWRKIEKYKRRNSINRTMIAKTSPNYQKQNKRGGSASLVDHEKALSSDIGGLEEKLLTMDIYTTSSLSASTAVITPSSPPSSPRQNLSSILTIKV